MIPAIEYLNREAERCDALARYHRRRSESARVKERGRSTHHLRKAEYFEARGRDMSTAALYLSGR